MLTLCKRLIDQDDTSMAAHIFVGLVLFLVFVGLTIAHAVAPSIAWDPQGYGIGAGGLTAAIGLGNWGGPKKP